MPIELNAHIERITYTNEETGYSVVRLKVSGRPDLITAVGNLIAPSPGERIHVTGDWITHPKFGEQFRIDEYRIEVPATEQGIRKYLGSGMIRGIGPVMAERIVAAFGVKALDVIERETGHLETIEGIGPKRIAMIQTAWNDQKEIRNVMLFLQTHGVGPAFANRIFKSYGNRAIALVRENPYRLAADIPGIGFVSADRIAENLGFSKNCLQRREAGIQYVLNRLSDKGHVCCPTPKLLDECETILEIDHCLIDEALASAAGEKRVVVEHRPNPEDPLLSTPMVYLPRLHASETGVARKLKEILTTPTSFGSIDAKAAVQWIQGRLSITLAARQIEAVTQALGNKLLIITGGPGTGKTTIIHAILQIARRANAEVLLAAPTGRAAKRISESTGVEARTIHRLLEYNFKAGGFQKNEEHPLSCDFLIVDEASMIDTVLMHHLLKALPVSSSLILVGDVNQLPSIGPGNVLKDVIASGLFPVVVLNDIFRQASTSRIITSAHDINKGVLPNLETDCPDTDFFFIEQEDPEKILGIITRLVRDRIPERFGLDPLNDIQVLTPMHKGIAGSVNLNQVLQEALNPIGNEVVRGGQKLRVGDKVMQIRNNYDREVFNGDIGKIEGLDMENRELSVLYDGRSVVYDADDLDEIVPAYAVSVHKSQRSEYPAVVMPVLMQHYMLLQRNLIYTAVTRGRRLVVLVGTRKALAVAIRNSKPLERWTGLVSRLRQGSASI